MNDLRIMEWNINQRSKNRNIKPFICAELIKSDPHFIILVEYKKNSDFENELRKQGYVVKTSKPKFKRNEVFIAVKEDRNFSDIGIDATNLDESLDLLSLKLTYKEKKLCIIGVRVLVGNGKKEDYQNRGGQIQALNGYVNDIKSKFDSIIIAGDFNHAKIHDEENDNYSYDGYAQKPCSYQFIKKTFRQSLFELYSPKGEYNTVFSWVGKNRRNLKPYYEKLDHLILSQDLICLDIRYEWNFISPENGYDDISKFDYKSGKAGLPDHAMLIADIRFRK